MYLILIASFVVVFSAEVHVHKKPSTETMELPEDVVQTVDEFEGKLGELEKLLLPIFQVDFQTLVSSLSPLDNAKFHLTVAYALNTLFYSKDHCDSNLNEISVPEDSRPSSCRSSCGKRTGTHFLVSVCSDCVS